jgi:hypothetical protein
MTRDQAMQALEILEAGDGQAAIEMLKDIIAGASSDASDVDAGVTDPSVVDARAEDGDDDGSEGDGAEGVAPPRKATALQQRICAEKGISEARFLEVQTAMQRPLRH